MTKLKKMFLVGSMVIAFGITSVTAFAAATYKTPAEAVAGITGRTLESVVAERIETGKTYGAMAIDADKLEEYKAANLEIQKDRLNAQVAAGKITQTEADAIIKAIEENQILCDGTGSGRIGQGMGGGCGVGGGRGQGGRRGMGLQNGSCLTQ